MKIVTSLFDSIDGVFWYPMIALFIFLVIFIVMMIHTFSLPKNQEKELSRIPLEEDRPDHIQEM
ncbi:MAG: CcoQ/FixQ family Cbb3-type cytochrome c oxidase assembly chaperone [Bacteroidetes bacterium]|nr:CcoQ/FixQ family Cbb3-type cytochrome c oxidase assembly chaperone [Bacteroidota bacterium]